ncbi:uncharacterized protein BDW70DRAFT_169893 [Aspergillus foveolatus]|uniref:uncharacterized protein n=1 Tax=Aspergillus foveolatus TaxID=210207 RepID=UPI003CCCE10D
MATSTYLSTRSAYGTRYSTSTSGASESYEIRKDHYDLFLLIQDLVRGNDGFMLEFPVDDWGKQQSIKITLGTGGFSSVQRRIAKGRWGNRSVMAYKSIRPRFDQDGRFDDQDALEQAVVELRLLSASGIRSHRHITQLKGISFETPHHRTDGYFAPVLMFDASSMGNLLDFIRDPVRMVDGPYWEFCLDVARGLQALHGHGFIHGDVKCENVLIFPAKTPQGRSFIAKVTDFGCSMAIDEVGAQTRLRGSTIPYDAPEADGVIKRENLVFTDVYSFGLLVWRVLVDGADPFKHSRYATVNATVERYNYSLIREDKRNGTALSLALDRVMDPDSGLSPEMANVLGEVLSIALNPEPQKRDLGRILEVLDRPENLQKRLFGLAPSNAQFLREFTKFEIDRFVGHAQASRGLAQWESVPAKADQAYHIVRKYGMLNSDFRGFGMSRLSPVSGALRDLLLTTENLYHTHGQPIPALHCPKLPASNDPVRNPEAVWQSLMHTIYLVSKDAGAMVTRVGKEMNSLLERAPNPRRDGRFGAVQGLFDFPGGLAAADTMAMMREDTMPKATSQDAQPTQLFTDISLRARRLVVQADRCLATMEEAICHCIGFGVEQDYSRYLAIVKECCEAGYQPAQAALSQIHHALGLPLGDGIHPYPIGHGGESPLPESVTPFPYSTDLHQAVVQRNQTALVDLIRNGASAMDIAGPAIFHKQHSFALDAVQLACSYHDAEMLEILLDAAPFYPINVDGNTTFGLLYFAIQCQNTHLRMARYGIDTYFQLEKTIQLLLRRGAANIVDKDGMTALHLAAACDMPDILEYVLTVDVLTQDINTELDGKTPLDTAIFKGNPAAFDLLVAAGAQVSRSSLAGHALNIPVQVTPSNDYFLKKTLELGAQTLTANDKHTALQGALQLHQWAIADFLMSQGANINGLTMNPNQTFIRFTVFGDVLSSWNLGDTLAVLDRLMSLAAKHHQEPQFIVSPSLHSSALHIVAGQISAMAQEEIARIYPLLLAKFPSKDQLEARDYRGWTALHLAVSVRNVVAVRALLDAGADINSMALVEGHPAGPSPKDMAFGQFFNRASFLDFEPGSRDRADRALEQLIKLFTSERYSKLAKRSVTLRAEQRPSVTAQHRQVMDYVDELAQRPRPLHPQHSVSLTNQLVQAVAGGDKEEAVQMYQKTGHGNVGKSIEWAGIECVRFLRHEGAGLLRDMGLLDDYLCD